MEAFKKNKKVLFLFNPPYATAGNNKRDAVSKAGVSNTKIKVEMKENGYGKSSQNLFAQFLYRIEKIKTDYKLKDVYIAVFCPTLFLTGTSFDKFREHFLKDFKYIDGFQFQASHFADVSSNWGIGFTIWKNGESENKNDFTFDNCIVDVNSEVREIKVKNKKCIYNIDNEISASDWVREPVKKLKVYDEPNMSSGIKIKNSLTVRGKNFRNNIGYFSNEGNHVGDNAQCVAMFSTAFSHGGGVGITKDNFIRCCALFSARRIIINNWTNWTDEYLAPDESNPNYEEFVNNSVIFSLFESKSQ